LLVAVEAAAMEIREAENRDMYFTYEGATSGTGSFATRSVIEMGGPHVDNRDLGQYADVTVKEQKHGSGTIDDEVLTVAERLYFFLLIDNYSITKRYASIWMAEDSSMTYSPVTIPVGRGYYGAHPIHYNSTLKEKNCIKNYATETSMQHETLYAGVIDKDLEVLVKDKNYDNTGWHLFDAAWTEMNVSEDVSEGTTELGVLQGNTRESDTSAWKSPIIDIQDRYQGTYHIDQKMSLYWPVERYGYNDSWYGVCPNRLWTGSEILNETSCTPAQDKK
jgi:hypothetical protein